MKNTTSSKDPLAALNDLPLDPESRAYIRYHTPRYHYLFDLARRAANEELGTVLDIGPAYQTRLLQELFPEIRIDTLGFADPRFPVRSGGTHHEFDLNHVQTPGVVPRFGPYDLIIMGEVIEHLTTAPELVLTAIRDWTRPGGRLIIQTPNALALPKRLKLLIGIHPFERIRTTPQNPGHFREYTPQELTTSAKNTGWEVAQLSLRNYFRGSGIANRLYNAASPLLPGALRSGISLVLRRPEEATPR